MRAVLRAQLIPCYVITSQEICDKVTNCTENQIMARLSPLTTMRPASHAPWSRPRNG
ncbi:hypothetical protein A7A09_007220 [Paracoccus methylarcula]|uniref:Uncharacterized protein n=1 Tax=Paracoccus methylarcula TaxID=72022 RepID=A0A3R7LIQ5_9RHOB|nr:hypothetical protein A7A09_007220 [Paracoccus methylarcula]